MMNILVTVGPASDDKNSLNNFAKNTKLFRLNGSHGTLDWHKSTVKSIREVCPNAFILMDIPGIKPRTANIKNIKVLKGQEVVFGNHPDGEKRLTIELTRSLPAQVKSLQKFSLNDGQFEFDLLESGRDYIVGKSRSNFTLLPKKGINLPNSVYDENLQAEVYKAFIKNVKSMGIDGLGLSFVQTGELVSQIRALVPNLVLVSKVENSEGLRNCIDIINQSDAIMIDRGDLAAEIGLENLYNAIETISDRTKAHGKPLVMATENLETMLERQVPSKSEVMSIAHSASIGVDCVMLSEETAMANSGSEIVSWLSGFLSNCSRLNQPKTVSTINQQFPTIWKAISVIEEMPVLLMTKSGYALFEYFSVKPQDEVILVTDNTKIRKICDLYANKTTVIMKAFDRAPLEILWQVIDNNKEKLFYDVDQLVAVYVSKYVNTARANSIAIFDKNDFILSSSDQTV